MKPIMKVDDFDKIVKEGNLEYSKGVIWLMRLARRYENRYNFFKKAEKDFPDSHNADTSYSNAISVMLDCALNVAQQEKKQGWKFVEAGDAYIKIIDLDYMDQEDFKLANLIYRLKNLGNLLITSKSLEYIQEETGFPETKEVVEQ